MQSGNVILPVPVFVRILAALRQGYIPDEYLAQLQSLSRPLQYSDGIEPNQLYVMSCFYILQYRHLAAFFEIPFAKGSRELQQWSLECTHRIPIHISLYR